MNWIPPGMANMLVAKAQLWKENNILIYRGMIMGISHCFHSYELACSVLSCHCTEHLIFFTS